MKKILIIDIPDNITYELPIKVVSEYDRLGNSIRFSYAELEVPTDEEMDDTAIFKGKQLVKENRNGEYVSGFIHGWVESYDWILNKLKLNK
jgi:hypothetical protein